jgi:hypothetical protein
MSVVGEYYFTMESGLVGWYLNEGRLSEKAKEVLEHMIGSHVGDLQW